MVKIKAALLGYGTVGQGIAAIIHRENPRYLKQYGFEIELVGVLVQDPTKNRESEQPLYFTTSFQELIAQEQIEVVFEAIVGEEPAFSYVKEALERKISVITANKAMFSTYGQELIYLANKYDVQVRFEATVAGAIPIVHSVKRLKETNEITRIQGILNGTSNYILTAMREQNWTFDHALAEAQRLGFAEADPTADVSGLDAFRKLRILTELAFDDVIEWSDVPLRGITELTSDALQYAEADGKRYRHIAEVMRDEHGRLRASVGLELLAPSHPLFAIDGVDNAIRVDTSYAGTITLVGPGAGKFPTASVMMDDVLEVIRLKLGEKVGV